MEEFGNLLSGIPAPESEPKRRKGKKQPRKLSQGIPLVPSKTSVRSTTTSIGSGTPDITFVVPRKRALDVFWVQQK